MNRDKQIEEMKKLQDRLIKGSCTEYNTVTSMYLVEASKAIGILLEDYQKASEVAREVLGLVRNAWETTYYEREFEERLSNLEKKYESEGEKNER